MKHVIVIPDGAADQPQAALAGRTPLQAARTPGMDALAVAGRVGLTNHVPDSLPPGSEAYALAFTVRMDAPGLVFLCRDSGIRPTANAVDAPFSTRFDEQDALCIFDDVEIPKADVFIDGDVAVYNQVMGLSSWWPS